MNSSRHLTTRRGFVATLGFGGVSLYGLWVGYGAAPDPLALFRKADAVEDPMAADEGAMVGHGMGPYDDIVDACCNAWNFFANDPVAIASITSRTWAQVS